MRGCGKMQNGPMRYGDTRERMTAHKLAVNPFTLTDPYLKAQEEKRSRDYHLKNVYEIK